MSRSMLVLSVALAGYAVLSTAASLVVALAWRAGALDRRHPSPATRARRLVMIRAVPVLTAAIVTLGLVAPGFAAFEPVRLVEAVGPVLILLATATVVLIGSAMVTAARTAIATRKMARECLRAATALDFDPPAGVPAFAIESSAPVVALVGVFAPTLIAARVVIEACSREELADIVAHERAHLRARDNLKRWLMACTPDALRWTVIHREMTAAWRDAAEDAADDAATAGHPVARLRLAALLLKVARLAPASSSAAVAVSPFVEPDGLDRRVRRLLASDPGPDSSPWSLVVSLAALCLATAVLAGLNSPATQSRVHEIVEAIVVFGR